MTFKVRDIISTTAFATRRSQKIYTIHELLERSFRGVNLISIRKLTRAALPRLNWTRALLLFFFFLSSPPAPRSVRAVRQSPILICANNTIVNPPGERLEKATGVGRVSLCRHNANNSRTVSGE